jgi:hypothetical protein
MATELVEIGIEKRIGAGGNNLELYIPKSAVGEHIPGDDLGYTLLEPIPGLRFVFLTSDAGDVDDVLTTETIGDQDKDHYRLVLSADLLPGIEAVDDADITVAQRFAVGPAWAIQILLPFRDSGEGMDKDAFEEDTALADLAAEDTEQGAPQ